MGTFEQRRARSWMRHLTVKIEVLNQANDKKVVKTGRAARRSFLSCGPHHWRFTTARSLFRIRDREHGGSQTGRVCAHAHLQGAHRGQQGSRDQRQAALDGEFLRKGLFRLLACA